jgi:hypothetical protein
VSVTTVSPAQSACACARAAMRGPDKGRIETLNVDVPMVSSEMILNQTMSDCAQLRLPMEFQIFLRPNYLSEHLN